MANTAQARKRARQAVKLNAHNSSQRSALRTAVKKVLKALDANDAAGANNFVTAKTPGAAIAAVRKLGKREVAARLSAG